MESHYYRWRAAKFDLCSALMAIEQWGIFSVLYLLCHGASVYNDHLQGPLTLIPVAEQWSCHYLFFSSICRGWDSNTQTSVRMRGERSIRLRHRCGFPCRKRRLNVPCHNRYSTKKIPKSGIGLKAAVLCQWMRLYMSRRMGWKKSI